MKPYLSDMAQKQAPVISVFEGLNTAVEPQLIKESTATDMQNIDSRGYPAICSAPPRETVDTAGTNIPGGVRYIGRLLLKKDVPGGSDLEQEQTEEHLAFVAGSSWWYLKDGQWHNLVSMGTYFSDYMDGVFFVDKNILVAGKNTNRAAVCTLEGEFDDISADNGFPQSNFIISHANRLYAASRSASYLRGSGLRNPNKWTSATDSVTFEFETADDECCSGIASYAERLLFFKPHSIFEIYGTDPLVGYQTTRLSGSIGCVSHKTITEVGGTLYFLGDGAVYSYGGGSLPKNVGLPVQKYLDGIKDPESACAACYKNRYWLSIKQNEGGVLLVFDTETGMWYKRDNIFIKCFAVVNDMLYGATDTGIYKMEGEGEPVEWYWHSKHFSSGAPGSIQNWKRLYIRFEKEDGARLGVRLVNNRGEEQDITGRVTGNIMRVELPPRLCHRAEWIQLRLYGEGKCKIHAVERYVRTRGGSW